MPKRIHAKQLLENSNSLTWSIRSFLVMVSHALRLFSQHTDSLNLSNWHFWHFGNVFARFSLVPCAMNLHTDNRDNAQRLESVSRIYSENSIIYFSIFFPLLLFNNYLVTKQSVIIVPNPHLILIKIQIYLPSHLSKG